MSVLIVIGKVIVKMIQRKLDYEKNIKLFQDIGDLYKLEEENDDQI